MPKARPGLHFSWPRHYTIGIWIQSLRRRGPRRTRPEIASAVKTIVQAHPSALYDYQEATEA